MQKTEAVVLHSLNFMDHDRILTVFSLDFGLVKFIVKNAKRFPSSVFSPFSLCELVLIPSSGDLWRCRELSLLNGRLALRDQLSFLQAGSEMIQALFKTQMPHNPAPELYQLFNLYLDRLPDAKNPFVLSNSFKLKMLRHEGFFHNSDDSFSIEEKPLIHLLAYGRSFQELITLDLPIGLSEKIFSLFIKATSI